MRFSIITPSFKQIDWLRLAVASVRDQVAASGKIESSNPTSNSQQPKLPQPLHVEHIVQDAGSPGIEEFAREAGAEFHRNGGKVFDSANSIHGDRYRLVIFSEPDQGMYDAVNQGYRKASGDFFAYLNCDEQYLPGALGEVGQFFHEHPNVETVFGDAIIIYSDGTYMCHRKGLAPQKAHTLVSENLSFATASAFSRASVFRDRSLYFDTKWKDVGDAAWGYSLCAAGVPMASLGFATTAFTDTGDNMNMRPNALREKDEMRKSAPPWMQTLRPLVIAHYRLRKALSGAYSLKPGSYRVMTKESPANRQEFRFEKPSHRWVGR